LIPEKATKRIILLSTPEFCRATTDVRGNLGPASVLLSSNNNDWIKDRWQAASDMHGTNIRGSHWVELEFFDKNHKNTTRTASVVITKVELDWEAAYADSYELAVRTSNGSTIGGAADNNSDKGSAVSSWKTVYLSNDSTTKYYHKNQRRIRQWGQSPGVKTKTPLHVLHEIDIIPPVQAVSSLRLLIVKSVTGWGISLWQIKVFGYFQPA
jgi:hypothetical protein